MFLYIFLGWSSKERETGKRKINKGKQSNGNGHDMNIMIILDIRDESNHNMKGF